MRLHGRKVAIFGVFTALALIFSYVELLIPINFGIPGAKLGLANLMTVLVLYKIYSGSFCGRGKGADLPLST